VKPIDKRLVVAALFRRACHKISEQGKHEKWGCPLKCGQHVTSLPRHDTVTAGVIRNVIRPQVPAWGVASMTALAGKTDSVACTVLCEREGDWWVVTVPELEAGEVTQACTLGEVPATVADLVALTTGVDPASVEVNVRAHAGPGRDLAKLSRVALATADLAIAWRVIREALAPTR
jgi:hypothetical protein